MNNQNTAQDKQQQTIKPIVHQRTLSPIHIVETYPKTSSTLNLEWIGRGANGKDYAIKTVNDHNSNGFIPATELFCYNLAAELLIATPNYDLLILADNSVAFGSLWEGGVHTIKDVPMAIDVLKKQLPIKGLSSFLSKVYALDIFINNIDRHFGNYLIRDSYHGHIILAYDFSLAWYACGNTYGYEAINTSCNTKKWHEIIKNTQNFDVEIAKNTLSEIARLPLKSIEHIIVQIPDEWLSQDTKTEIMQWWASDERVARINLLKAGLS